MTDEFPFNLTFCVGAPRSGTTLLGSLLSEGDSCSPMLPECTYITQLIRSYHDIVEYSDPQRFAAYAKSPGKLAEVYQPTINRMVLAAADNFESMEFTNLILKDPELTPYLDLIPTFFSANCKVICVVRDPIAVIASMRKVLATEQKQVDDEALITRIFNYYWMAHESQLSKTGDVHFVRFENIIGRDETEFSLLENYLGYTIGRKGFGKVFFDFDQSDPTYSDNFGKPIVQKPDSNPGANMAEELIVKIHEIFSGFDLIYNWWAL